MMGQADLNQTVDDSTGKRQYLIQSKLGLQSVLDQL